MFHTYIHNWPLQPFSQDYCFLVSRTTYVVCIKFIYKIDAERQIFWESFHGNFIYSQSFWQKSAESQSPKKYFLYFVFMSNPGFTSNKPTQYQIANTIPDTASSSSSSCHYAFIRFYTEWTADWFVVSNPVILCRYLRRHPLAKNILFDRLLQIIGLLRKTWNSIVLSVFSGWIFAFSKKKHYLTFLLSS